MVNEFRVSFRRGNEESGLCGFLGRRRGKWYGGRGIEDEGGRGRYNL